MVVETHRDSSMMFQCPACTHHEFKAVTDVNDERTLKCLGCDFLVSIDDLQEYGEDPLSTGEIENL